MKRHAFTLVVLALTSAAAIQAGQNDRITLKSGRTVEGIIANSEKDSVEISTPDGQIFRFNRSSIRRISSSEEMQTPQQKVPANVGKTTAQAQAGLPKVEAEPEEQREQQGSSEGPVFRGGGVLGLNLANASFNPSTSSSAKIGFAVGPIFDVTVAENTFIQLELLYAQYGYSIDISGNNLTVAYNAFEIPIISKLRIDLDDSEFHPLLLLGTSLAFRLSATATDSTGTADFSSVTKSSMLSLIFGTGAEYDLSQTESLFLNARYLLGLTDVSNTSTSAKQSTFQFTVGYLGTF